MRSVRLLVRVVAIALCAGSAGASPAGAQSRPQPETTTCGQQVGFHQTAPAFEASQPADKIAIEIVSAIVTQVGTAANFRVRSAAFGNVAAVVCSDSDPPARVLLYDPRLIGSIEPGTPNYWTLMLAFAHEIGHHVIEHDAGGKDRPRLEKEADHFAGYVLARLGASEDLAAASAARLAAFQAGSGKLPTGAEAQSQRIGEVARGWRDGALARVAGEAAGAVPQRPGEARGAQARAGAGMSVKPDTYVEGEGYHAIVGTSVPICREACAQDRRCAMYEFHRPSRTCGFFDHATPSGPSNDAEVGIKTAHGANLGHGGNSGADAPAAGWALAIRQNVYVAGEGFQTIRKTTRDVCQQACLSQSRCVMYEFYRPTNGCGLFDHTRLAGSAQTAEVGMKTPVKTSIGLSPGSPPATLHLAVRQNAYVEGAGYRTLRQSSTPACRTACLAEARCAMYEFHRPSRSCGLFDHTKLAGESDEAETGIKVAR